MNNTAVSAASSFANGVEKAIRYVGSLDSIRGVSGLSASTVHNGNQVVADSDSSPTTMAASSLFSSFLTGGDGSNLNSTQSNPSTVGASLSSYVFRSISSSSTASINSFDDSSASLVGNSSAAAGPQRMNRIDSVSGSASVASTDIQMNAEDEEDEMLLARLAHHSRQPSTDVNLSPIHHHTQVLPNTSSGTVSAAAASLARSHQAAAHWLSTHVQMSFASVKDSVLGSKEPSTTVDEHGIDWDFWGKVINDYEGQLRKFPRQFTKRLHQGIPEPIRGMMWQLMTSSKSEMLEEEYLQLLTRHTRHEKIIQRDLARTFPNHPHFKDATGPGQNSLFNVLKAYSIYDQEIGYCQGIAFVVGPLLLNMPEEQAFCVLVRMMRDYGFRDLFSPKMIGLQQRNYQFDKLIDEQFPIVAKHLENQDIKSTMYASQWFMTLFAYRFPLDMVFRILDIVFAEGPESVLRFAVALIKHNAETIITLDFEPLLEFLKSGLFDQYITNTNQLVADASAIRLSKSKLDKWTTEFNEMMYKQSPEVMEAEHAKSQYRQLVEEYKVLESNYEILNREHVDLANHLGDVSGDRDIHCEREEELEQQVKALKLILSTDRKHAENEVRSEMNRLAERNSDLVRANAELQDDLDDITAQLADTKLRLVQSETDKEELKKKLDNLRKALGA
ncbi:hypothetical protein BDEG_26462 [Batrachochytrium dendrobatidis JEL423]|nr:hypothetical protein BDEG_26462 [Batrachochytrium dendrobatidis JEL423]